MAAANLRIPPFRARKTKLQPSQCGMADRNPQSIMDGI
ncbi:hypothetical protein SNOG_04816 [Parastagonospora nodorum SN15]|uniref:Uncharacterized protein n=1 Tax=Phaeosphaeria nodorum (strain SN15 / ATCC MYA-4574 / FGSC 10173) TaxID=321614 RepID=Q0UTU8_PHANO|nr:hypothetical protein SNOG_04816 [Parastagonospora nodorum SN15]EAT87207.1 hypothetical protein SNOG_04816 [Parastagonospora nodorum SN15]